MRTGILGGTFDPIHYGHLILAEIARDEYNLDRVVFIPTYIPPHKTEVLISDFHDRISMVSLAIDSNDKFHVSDIELKLGGMSYTVNTIQSIKDQYPEDDIFFFTGADQIMVIESWMEYDRLIGMCGFVGVTRCGSPNDQVVGKINEVNSEYGVDIEILEIPQIDISSTMIREKVIKGKSVRYLTPDNVVQYINEKKLFISNQVGV